MTLTLEEILKDCEVIFKGDGSSREERKFWVLQKGQELALISVDKEAGSFIYHNCLKNDGRWRGDDYEDYNGPSVTWFRTSGVFLAALRVHGVNPGQYQNFQDTYNWIMKEYQ